MVTDEHRRQFNEEGYFVLDEAMTAAELAELRAICDRYIAEHDSSEAVPEPEGAAGGDPEMQLRAMPDGRTFRTNVINRKGYRYLLAGHYFDDPVLREFMRGPLMAGICAATLGGEAYVYYDQFTVKGPEGAEEADEEGHAGIAEGAVFDDHFVAGYPARSNEFAWHQDGGYIPARNPPQVAVWLALDDMSEENGTLRVLPYSQAGTREPIAHAIEPGTHYRTADIGSHAGTPMIVPAGAAVVFSSNLFHCSRPNRSRAYRRALLAQYIAAPVIGEDGKQIHFADPFINAEAAEMEARRGDPGHAGFEENPLARSRDREAT